MTALAVWQRKLLAAGSLASTASADMMEAVRDGAITDIANVGSGETLQHLVDATRLLMEATTELEEEDGQLYAALVKWICDRTGILPVEGEVTP